MTDPRVSLGADIVGTDGSEVVDALDAVRPIVRVAPDLHPSAATAATVLGLLLARVFPHTTVDGNAELGPNPWAASTVTDAIARSRAAVPEPSREPVTDIVLTVGETGPGASLHVGGDDWTAAVSTAPTPVTPNRSALGVHAAACFAAAEVTKQVLGPHGLAHVRLPDEFVWNLANHQLTVAPGLDLPRPGRVRVVFAGCGSVGSSAGGALVCVDGLAGNAWTVDPDTIDPDRNPFRYPALTGHEAGHKATWVADLLRDAGWSAHPWTADVAGWVHAQPAPGLHGIAVSSVDTVEGRRDVADLLARSTISAGVSGLALHVQVETPADDFACPYCEFADVRTALEESHMRAQFAGLTEQRVIELAAPTATLTVEDVKAAVNAGKVHPSRGDELVGRRLDDLIRRAYAEAAVPGGEQHKPMSVSAPQVSWFAGVLLATEVYKAALGMPLLHRRSDIDLAGVPLGVTSTRPRDATGRCTCAQPIRRRWAERLYQ